MYTLQSTDYEYIYEAHQWRLPYGACLLGQCDVAVYKDGQLMAKGFKTFPLSFDRYYVYLSDYEYQTCPEDVSGYWYFAARTNTPCSIWGITEDGASVLIARTVDKEE